METKGYYAMSFYNTTDTMQTDGNVIAAVTELTACMQY